MEPNKRKGEKEEWRRLLTWVKKQFLFLEPNALDPLNKEAADDLKSSREMFKRNVKTSMAGGTVKGVSYDRVLR